MAPDLSTSEREPARTVTASRFAGGALTAALVAAGLAALSISIAVTVTIGPADLSVRDVYAVLFDKLGLRAAELSPIREGIVWQLRLPRTLLAAVCGAGLAVCGVIMQSLLRNPLADPFVLGISSGASTGAVVVAVLGVGGGLVSLSSGALIGALLSFALVLALAAGAGGGNARIVLAGVAATQLFSSLTSFIVLSSADAERTRGVLFWLLGSLAGADWADVALAAAVCLTGSAICLWQAASLDAFIFGSSSAATLGISVGRVRLLLLVVTAAITAVLVSVAGAIGFVGLVLPHAARFLVGVRHSRLLPVSAVTGAVFLVWVDALARTVFAPQEVPVGVLTALIGVPAFALLLFRTRDEG
ncbi:FecCD family ABC transporter permease [Nocardia shimofusensis]|uniref:FecCD family ABC transporter permease n=1 Tax=Nocardia shimofusensis TaxID=228596 RepID=UPI0009FCDFC1|nr:iron chelate uptake ABC transporter family permease subunit [Nocardia shimofusensis]